MSGADGRVDGAAAPPAVRPAAVYQPRYAPSALPRDLKLKSAEWGVLFALTGRHSVAQVAAHLGLTRAQAEQAFRGLLAAGLVVERQLALHEYLQAAAASDDPEPKTFAELLRGAPLRPTAMPVAVPPPARPVAARPLAVRPPGAATPRPRSAPPPFRPLTLEEPAMPAASPQRALSLQSLMRFIRGRAADETAGQLDVYRAFLRVDPKLLERHGITTLRFEEDRLVRDAELQRRILDSVETTLGVRCPPDVFVSG